MTGLYIHIPFCAKKCHYCNFVTTVTGSKEKEEKFIESLEKESAHYREYFKQRQFDTLYFGGGTPSALNIESLEKVFSILRRDYNFKKGLEITFEANPESLSDMKVRCLRDMGATRVSLGVQTFHDRTLKSLNRAHTSSDTAKAFETLRKHGFNNISLDLMLSLPGETLDDVKFSLEQVSTLAPEHVSLYELVVEEKTVFGRLLQKGDLALPAEEAQLEMLTYARQYLKNQGLNQYELLNYAKKGFESRHNLLYWENQEYLGLGPGAFSYFDGRRYRYSDNFEDYVKKISGNDWRACEEEILSPEKSETESFLLAMRKIEGADIEKFRHFIQKNSHSIDQLSAGGLIEIRNEKICFTDRGLFFAETVFSELSLQ